jgi:hypothetical protein
VSMALDPSVGPWPLSRLLNLYTVGSIPWTGRSARRKASTHTQNKSTPASMPLVGYEPTIPVFERVNTIHTLDRATTVISALDLLKPKLDTLFHF